MLHPMERIEKVGKLTFLYIIIIVSLIVMSGSIFALGFAAPDNNLGSMTIYFITAIIAYSNALLFGYLAIRFKALSKIADTLNENPALISRLPYWINIKFEI